MSKQDLNEEIMFFYGLQTPLKEPTEVKYASNLEITQVSFYLYEVSVNCQQCNKHHKLNINKIDLPKYEFRNIKNIANLKYTKKCDCGFTFRFFR
ncbi:hypothetical protein [Candidatus Lokiarchaeum ossiferum]|uniref:hypothetical protein n=1 Tax=Candidatus Lokiarchaeum ossiferum TaxID=2951803 RepID=UPI00352C3FC9